MDEAISKNQIDAILKLSPVFEKPERCYVEVAPPPEGDTNRFPYYTYSKEVLEFWRAPRENGFMIDFRWSAWQENAERLYENPELLKTADLDTLRKLLTTHVRKERFSEGHFAGMIRCGQIKAILARLAEIRANGGSHA